MEQVLSRVFGTWPSEIGLRSARTLRLWLSLWSERHALDLLDARLLRDIGLSEERARAEASRPMWDVPRLRQRR